MHHRADAHEADILVIGGGLGGCAAALAALESGARVILTEETDWIGGQMTSQLVPPDEHGWIERFGRTASYQRFREGVRAHYREQRALTEAARRDPLLNPGTAWVSPLAFEPKVGLAVLHAMLEPHRASGRLWLLLEHRPVGIRQNAADQIAAVVVEDRQTGKQKVLSGKFVIDATELGDLLALAAVEHVTGQESQTDTGEPSAPTVAWPENQQAFTWCFAVEHEAGADHVGAPPENYAYWRDYTFPIRPAWPGPIFSFTGLNPRTLEQVRYRFEPPTGSVETPTHDAARRPVIDRTLWTYRRILDRQQFLPDPAVRDVTVVNWPMNDYLAKSLLDHQAEIRSAAQTESRELSLALLHWLQTEAPRPEGGRGWPGLRLRPDIAGTPDGLAKAAYIREARRIKALYTIREQDVASSCYGATADRAREFEDSVGIGSYRIDLHPTTGGDNFVDVATLPFQIPLGALIPVRVTNLLPAAKNIGTTHITNGCYRLHPVEWNIGEAAGALAAFCLEHQLTPQRVHAASSWRERYQKILLGRGVELQWPQQLVLAEGDPHAHAG